MPATMFDKLVFPEYVFREYPKVLYGTEGKTVTVETEKEELALVGVWFTSPAEAKVAG